MTTWRELIDHEAAKYETGTNCSYLIFNTLSNLELDVEFNCNYGLCEGKPFTAWSRTRVYFPEEYDGRERVNSVPRHPCQEITDHAVDIDP